MERKNRPPPTREENRPQPPMQQIAREIIRYKKALIRNRVRKMLHIGIHNAGLEHYIAREYHKLNLPCKIVCVDLKENEEARDTIKYINRKFDNVRVKVIIADSMELKPRHIGETFDAAFIDGCHQYDYVKKDFQLAKRLVSKMIGFHDVAAISTDKKVNSADLWSEIKHLYQHESWAYSPTRAYGIGVLYLDRNRNIHRFTSPSPQSPSLDTLQYRTSAREETSSTSQPENSQPS